MSDKSGTDKIAGALGSPPLKSKSRMQLAARYEARVRSHVSGLQAMLAFLRLAVFLRVPCLLLSIAPQSP